MSSGGDLGEPISYAVLERGTPVLSSDETRIGTVAHVLFAEQADIFDGIVVGDLAREVFGPGIGRHRFVDAPEVASIHEHGVSLSIDAAACAGLPEPTENPTDAGAASWGETGGKLRRAWDLLSGRY